MQNDSRLMLMAQAIANPRRLQIARLCYQTWLTQKEIAQKLGVSQPTISNHLSVMADAGLIESKVDFAKRGLKMYTCSWKDIILNVN